MPNTQKGFYGLGIAPGLLETLNRLNFVEPTPIQKAAIPVLIEGKDIIGIAQTGTGKTLAFGVPMVQAMAQKQGRGLVLVPTRELAMQVHDTIQKLAPTFNLKTAIITGGQSMNNEFAALRKIPELIIATPGRLIDHIENHRLKLDTVKILVLDEADRMLDMGFMPQIEKILRVIPRQRQTMLFSATMPAEVVAIASRHMQLPVQTEIAPQGTAPDLVTQEMFVVRPEFKQKLLLELLKKYTGSVLLFTRTKRGASKVARFLKNANHRAAEIHSDRTTGQRKDALNGFKNGRYRILVATDIAARGIDVSGIEVVINYDLPDQAENYVHRIGRTGRAGMKGHAVSFAAPEQGLDVKSIEKIIRASIPRAEHPGIPIEPFYTPKNLPPKPGGGGFNRNRFRRGGFRRR